MGKKNLRKKKGLALMIYLLKKLSCVLNIAFKKNKQLYTIIFFLNKFIFIYIFLDKLNKQ